MADCTAITHDAARARMERGMRMYAGRGRLFSVVALAEVSGIPERTLKSYMEGATPGLHTFLTLIKHLGGGFAAQVLADAGVAAVIMHDDEPVSPHSLASAQSDNVASLIKALEDGVIDHTERPELIDQARRLITLLTAFVADEESKS